MILAAIKKQESGVGKQCMEEDDMKKAQRFGGRTKAVQENCRRTHLLESLHQIFTGKEVVKPADKGKLLIYL
jgi:hypothetical protein